LLCEFLIHQNQKLKSQTTKNKKFSVFVFHVFVSLIKNSKTEQQEPEFIE